MDNFKAIILAGGKGTRLHSKEAKRPKALHLLNDKPLIRYVLDGLQHIDPADIVIVVGYMGEAIRDYLGSAYRFVEQPEQLGTGHAALCAARALEGYAGDVLIGYGDMPLLRADTYRGVMETHRAKHAAATVLTAHFDPPLAYGRIIRDGDGDIRDIVEQSECTPEQAAITELNVGVNAYDFALLSEYLGRLTPALVSGEYYLTRVPPMLCKDGHAVHSHLLRDEKEIFGINTPEDLLQAQEVLQARL